MTGPARKTPPQIFDRGLLARRRQRAAKSFPDADFLHRRIAKDVIDRLETVQRTFRAALFAGPGAHLIADQLTADCAVEAVRISDPYAESDLIVDEEALQLPPETLDLFISIMALHNVNDLPGALINIRKALKPDGLFIGVLPAEESLTELRQVLYQAESEITGGVSAHIAPFAAIKDLGGLMQRAGLGLPVADVDNVRIRYKNPIRLLHDLRAMGEGNILLNRRKTGLRKDVLMRMSALYGERFADEAGTVTASFDLVTLTGWAPHESQQKPLRPGSGKVSLKSAIDDLK